MSKYFIGLMTGTSADSIDGCVVDFSNGFELIYSESNNLEKTISQNMRKLLKKALRKKKMTKLCLSLRRA